MLTRDTSAVTCSLVLHSNSTELLVWGFFPLFPLWWRKAPESEILLSDWWDFVQAVTVHNSSHCPICWPPERLRIAQPWDVKSSSFFFFLLSLFTTIGTISSHDSGTWNVFLSQKVKRKLVSSGCLMGLTKQMPLDLAVIENILCFPKPKTELITIAHNHLFNITHWLQGEPEQT